MRSTDDPAAGLAQALCDFCRTPYVYQTPSGGRVEVDLPGHLSEAVGEPAGAGPAAIGTVRKSLASDPDRLKEVLSAVALGLPFTLVVVIDQAEEMFTLAAGEEQAARRDAFLESVRRLAASSGRPVKLIISLRTEFYGRLIDRLRRGLTGAIGTREYLLLDLEREGLLDAICRPTLSHPIRYADQVPDAVYRFHYAPGVPEAIAEELIRAGRRDGVLPLVQFLCDQLYRRVRGREDPTVTLDDFEQIGRLRGGLGRHLEQQLALLAPNEPLEQNAFKDLLARLVHRQIDGTLTTELIREDQLAADWRGKTPFFEILARAESLACCDSAPEGSTAAPRSARSAWATMRCCVAETWREEAARRHATAQDRRVRRGRLVGRSLHGSAGAHCVCGKATE